MNYRFLMGETFEILMGVKSENISNGVKSPAIPVIKILNGIAVPQICYITLETNNNKANDSFTSNDDVFLESLFQSISIKSFDCIVKRLIVAVEIIMQTKQNCWQELAKMQVYLCIQSMGLRFVVLDKLKNQLIVSNSEADMDRAIAEGKSVFLLLLNPL